MTKAVYPAVIREDDGWFWAEFPDLPGCFGQGGTLVECAKSASDVLVTHLSAMEYDGVELPEPTTPKVDDGMMVAWFYADTSELEEVWESWDNDQ